MTMTIVKTTNDSQLSVYTTQIASVADIRKENIDENEIHGIQRIRNRKKGLKNMDV